MSMVIGIGADSGASAAWAGVAVERGQAPCLILLEPIYGTDPHWSDRSLAGAEKAHRMAPDATWWIERPVPRVNADTDMAHHATGVGLGIRIGRLQEHAYKASGRWPVCVEPGNKSPEQITALRTQAPRHNSGLPQWWWYALPTVKLRPKTDAKYGDGIERVAQASLLVRGAKDALEAIPVSRRVDCAESIIIAMAAAWAQVHASGWPT